MEGLVLHRTDPRVAQPDDWISFLLLLGTWIFVFRTPYGLRLRAVGEHPRAADTVGISVYKTRYVAVIASGAIAAMGGAYLSIGFVHAFSEGMTTGPATSGSPR